MPENLKNILESEVNMPFILGMVAQAKGFIIDRPMIVLIGSFIGAGIICGGLLHEVKQLSTNQAIMQKQMQQMIKDMTALALSQNTMSSDVKYMKADVVALTEGFSSHMLGHPIRITK
jgi:hypothetical protein